MKLLKPTDVAERLAISRSMAYKLIEQGDIPHVLVGTAIRVREDDLNAYIERRLAVIA